MTLESRTAPFGHIAGTYQLAATDASHSRLVAKLMLDPPRGLLGALMRHLLPAGDFIMMRKQLLTLKFLAERSFKEGSNRDAR